MKTRVGAIGVSDTLQLFESVAKNYKTIEVIPFLYKNGDDIEATILNHGNTIDVWVFSGQVPYSLASERGLLKRDAFYPELNGSSLIRSLIEIIFNDRLSINRLSFDTLVESEIYETFSELNLPTSELYMYSYKGYRLTEELIDFHLSLYKNNKIDACVTCMRSVYEGLKHHNVPVYRITPTKMAIKQVLDRAMQQGETMWFKKSQIAVLLVHSNDSSNERYVTSYDDYRLHLKLQEVMVSYAEAVSGTLIPIGNKNFMIFSTRGSVEIQLHSDSQQLLEKLQLNTDLTINIGVGYGTTALTAEKNARLGIKRAQHLGGNCTILVDENGVIEGPLHHTDSLSFSYQTDKKEVQEALKKAKVSITTLNKLLAIQEKISVINSNTLAEWLGTSQRNARRILSSLEKEGFATIVGEESPATTGRPRINYRVEIPE